MIPNELCDEIIAWGEAREWKTFEGANTKWAKHDYILVNDKVRWVSQIMEIIAPLMGEYGVAEGLMRLTRYNVGDYIGTHQDTGDMDRKLTIVIQLSDPKDYEGGNLVVEGVPMSKERGTILTHDPLKDWHEVLPVIKGTRYTLVIWLK